MGMTPKTTVAKCQSLCKARASKNYARILDGYFKGVVGIHGLRAPQVDQIYKEVAQMAEISKWDAKKVFSTGLTLLSCDFQEEKRLGVLFLKHRRPAVCVEELEPLADTIDAHVYDWATSDILSGVLRKAIERDESVVPLLVAWSDAACLWRRRAACVAFLSFAKRGLHCDAIETICDRSVRMNERFVQLGVGWLLREFSCYDRERVIEFLRSHFEWTSREGLRYALEKMPTKLRKQLMDEHKEHNSKTTP